MGWDKKTQEKFPESWAKIKAKLPGWGAKSMLGKHQSALQKKRTSEASKGKKWVLGKRWKWTEEQKQKARESFLNGTRVGSNKGRHFTAEHKEKIRQSNLGLKRRPETIAKIKINRAKQTLPLQDTSIEVALQNELTRRGIIFIKHKQIYGLPDLFIEPNICIFADGDYWHNRPEAIVRDKKTNEVLTAKGYKIYRFWEKDINTDVKKCIDSIIL